MDAEAVSITTLIVTLLISMGVPSAFVAFAFRRLEKKLAKREKENDKKEAARRKNEIIIIESMNAAIALGEATARAVQRIPDAQCNGDMHAALDYATSIKHKHKDFITEQGIDALY